jgi:hypothetical protein
LALTSSARFRSCSRFFSAASFFAAASSAFFFSIAALRSSAFALASSVPPFLLSSVVPVVRGPAVPGRGVGPVRAAGPAGFLASRS